MLDRQLRPRGRLERARTSQRCWTCRIPTLTSARKMKHLQTQSHRIRSTSWSLELMRERRLLPVTGKLAAGPRLQDQ